LNLCTRQPVRLLGIYPQEGACLSSISFTEKL
jgi:hypothetical protein